MNSNFVWGVVIGAAAVLAANYFFNFPSAGGGGSK
jgi:hypothetical protein